MRVSAHAHGDHFDQRRPLARAGALRGPREGGGHFIGIGAVDGEAGNAVAGGLVGEHARGRVVAHRRRERGLVVLQAEDRRQLGGGAGVDRFVPLAERRAAFADERQRHALAALDRERHRQAGHRERSDRQRRGGGQHAPAPIAGVEVLAEHRRAGLAHLRAQDHRHRFFVVAHRERHAEIANHRRHHVAAPLAIGLAIRGAALQANRAGIDGFLAERSEALALEGHLAPADLAAHEELLQAIVDAPGETHAFENLATLVFGERRFDRRAAQKAVAGVNQLRARLLEPFGRGHTRRGFGDAVRRRDVLVERLRQRATERGPRRIELHRIATLDGADTGALERIQSRGAAQTDSVRRRRRRNGWRGPTIS